MMMWRAASRTRIVLDERTLVTTLDICPHVLHILRERLNPIHRTADRLAAVLPRNES